MCYPKPGPRCSAHARNAYVKAKAAARRDRNFATEMAEREALDEFYTTPAGFRELERLISIGEYKEKHIQLLAEHKQLRKDRLAAIKAIDEGDITHNYLSEPRKRRSKPLKLPALDSERQSWKRLSDKKHKALDEAYIDESSAWADTLSEEEEAAVRWMTSNGFQEMHQLATGEHITPRWRDSESQEDKAIRIARMKKTLEGALAKAPDKQRIVYRGVGAQSVPTELAKQISVDGRYKPQYNSDEEYETAKKKYLDDLVQKGEFSFGSLVSSSEDPGVAVRFAGSQYSPDVIYEIAAKRGTPCGSLSAWLAAETEIVLPADAKYRVLGYAEGVSINSNPRGSNSRSYDDQFIIIQMEEI